VPRLAGRREGYLVKALREYKSNARRGYDASMADVLYAVTDADMLDLAPFLARHRRTWTGIPCALWPFRFALEESGRSVRE
jgi:cytochrome c553